MAKKRSTKRIKLSDDTPKRPESPTFNPNASSLAPNTRADRFGPVDANNGRQPFAKTPFPSAAGAQAASTAGVSIFQQGNGNGEEESTAFQTGAKQSLVAAGNSGTQIFGGYFSEEYLSTLRGRNGAKQWDEMRRSEAQISMLMNAIKNPIKSANWDIEAYDTGDADCVKHAELSKACIFDMVDFDTFKNEALTVIDFGFCLLEVVHSVERNHPKFGTFNGLRALSFRSQKTIENWMLEPKTGKLLGVNQYTYSDLGGNEFIPGEFLLVFTHLKEGDNYEGISALRPMLGAYKRKELYLKLAAIGIERYAIGTPIGTVPKGKEKTTEYDEFKKTLQNYTSHEASYITVPEGWKIDIQKGDFDASKIKELLTFENGEFCNAVVGNFLSLGMNGGGGAYALGSNLGEFFTTGIQSYADLICDVMNRQLIPNLIKLNYGDQKGYPKMKVTGISDKAGKELAEVIKFLADARALEPDKPLKEHLRKLYKLPKPDVDSAIALPQMPAGASANYPKPNDPVIDPKTGKVEVYNPSQRDNDPTNDASKLHEHAATIKLADAKYVKRFDANKDKLKECMQTNLKSMYEDLKAALKKKYKSLGASEKILTAKGMDMPGANAYKATLRVCLALVADQALKSARKSIPNGSKIKLAEYDDLPASIRKIIEMQADLLSSSQISDIEKIVYFHFTSATATLDDIDAILNEVDEAVLPTLDGSTAEGVSIDAAAGNAVAQVTQQTSMSFFQDDEVLDGIESFTFTNEDPVSEICQSLAGITFAVGDPDLDTYSPPLHHNCKSRLVPNLKGDSDNPEIDRGGVSLSKKALDSITLSERHKK